jgi:hypothetical protein
MVWALPCSQHPPNLACCPNKYLLPAKPCLLSKQVDLPHAVSVACRLMYLSGMGHRLLSDGSHASDMNHVQGITPAALVHLDNAGTKGGQRSMPPLIQPPPPITLEESRAAVTAVLSLLPQIYRQSTDLYTVLLAYTIPLVGLALHIIIKTGANPIFYVHGRGTGGKSWLYKFAAYATGMLDSQMLMG